MRRSLTERFLKGIISLHFFVMQPEIGVKEIQDISF